MLRVKPLIAIAIMAIVAMTAAAQGRRKAAKIDPAVQAEKIKTAIAEYNFSEALSLLNDYNSPDAERLENTARLGSQMLERVEDVVVFDSIIVDKDAFFEAYRLSPAAGEFRQSDGDINSPLYITQSGITEFFAIPDSAGQHSLASARVLVDGSIEAPRIYPNPEGIDDAAYPFLMPDGMTLYYAGTGEQSLGGYDIFITRRGGVDEDFLQPQNLGMPFNSLADDYLMVIDEATGIGWWASDRNNIPGNVTIYMFVPSELRSNLSPETPMLLDRAKLTAIADTHPEGYEKPNLDKLIPAKAAAGPQFQFALPGGRLYTTLDDFSSPASRELMEEYLELQRDIAYDRDRLAAMRASYKPGDDKLAQKILLLEQDLDKAADELQEIANDLARSEGR